MALSDETYQIIKCQLQQNVPMRKIANNEQISKIILLCL